MSFEAVHNAIRKRFKSEVQDLESFTVLYDNAPDDTPDASEWVRFEIDNGVSLQISFGATKRFRRPGTAVAQIHVKASKGDQRALEIADKIVTAFRAVTVTEAGAVVHFRTPMLVNLGRVSQWWQVNVNCPYYSDIVA